MMCEMNVCAYLGFQSKDGFPQGFFGQTLGTCKSWRERGGSILCVSSSQLHVQKPLHYCMYYNVTMQLRRFSCWKGSGGILMFSVSSC